MGTLTCSPTTWVGADALRNTTKVAGIQLKMVVIQKDPASATAVALTHYFSTIRTHTPGQGWAGLVRKEFEFFWRTCDSDWTCDSFPFMDPPILIITDLHYILLIKLHCKMKNWRQFSKTHEIPILLNSNISNNKLKFQSTTIYFFRIFQIFGKLGLGHGLESFWNVGLVTQTLTHSSKYCVRFI